MLFISSVNIAELSISFSLRQFALCLLVAALMSCCQAAPQKAEEPIAIISQESNIEPDGSYNYG